MPIITANPAVDADGKSYENLLVRANISPKNYGSTASSSVAFNLLPYRLDGEGNIVEFDGPARTMRVGDVVKGSDDDLKLLFSEFAVAIQKYVTAKGL